MFNRIRAKNFLGSTNGNMTLMLAGTAMGLILAVGVAIDAGKAFERRSAISQATDAAILAAISTAGENIKASKANWTNSAEKIALATFKQDLENANVKGANVPNVQLTLSGTTLTGNMTYKEKYVPALMSMFGVGSMDIAYTSTASAEIPTFVTLHLLIDASPSMGIGATKNDQQMMQAATGCTVACHYTVSGVVGDNYAAERATGAKFRIDVVKDSVKNLIASIKAKNLDPNSISISIDLFSNDIIPLIASTTDLDAVLAAADGIDLQSSVGNLGTNINYSLSRLLSKIGKGGTGKTTTDRESFVVLLSDGVEDSPISTPSAIPGEVNWAYDTNIEANAPIFTENPNMQLQSMAPDTCKAVKSAKHKMVTAEVEYLIPDSGLGDGRYDFVANTLQPLMKKSFQDCASEPSYAQYATSSADIEAMFGRILDIVTEATTSRLTQ